MPNISIVCDQQDCLNTNQYEEIDRLKKELEAVKNRTCEFKFEYDDINSGAGIYSTQCKAIMKYLSYFKYCPYCGGKILIKAR